MNIYMIHSAAETELAAQFKLLHGRLSYIAQGNTLLSEKLTHTTRGDIMILSAKAAGEHITPAIYDECRRRRYSGVFLDTDECPDDDSIRVFSEVSASLARRSLKVFCPLQFSDICPSAIPVAEASVSGGILSEHIQYLTHRHKRLALSIPRVISDFALPLETSSGRALTPRELSQILGRFDSHIHFSPQMLTNYFIYSPSRHECNFVLFDDARTISEKLRLAKKLGVSDVFITYREINDIASDIIF